MPGVTRTDLNNVAQTIASARAVLSQHIAELDAHVWAGDDADRFRQQWDSDVTSRLLTLERTVRDLTLETFQG